MGNEKSTRAERFASIFDELLRQFIYDKTETPTLDDGPGTVAEGEVRLEENLVQGEREA